MYDFAGTRSLNPVVGAQPAQFTRDSRAFTFDPTGKLVRVPAGVPRFRHADGRCEGLLVERSATNRAEWPEQLSPDDLAESYIAAAGPGMSSGGVLSIVDDAEAIRAAGLELQAGEYAVKLDLSAASDLAYLLVYPNIDTENGKWSISGYARGAGTVRLRTGFGNYEQNQGGLFTLNSEYQRVALNTKTLETGAANAADIFWVQISAGQVMYFILPQIHNNLGVFEYITSGVGVTYSQDGETVFAPVASSNVFSGYLEIVPQPHDVEFRFAYYVKGTTGTNNFRIQTWNQNDWAVLSSVSGSASQIVDSAVDLVNGVNRVAFSYNAGVTTLVVNGRVINSGVTLGDIGPVEGLNPAGSPTPSVSLNGAYRKSAFWADVALDDATLIAMTEA